MRQAAVILDRAAWNLQSLLVSVGVRLTPEVSDRVRGVLSSAIAEGITLGERYAQWRRGHVRNPFPEYEERDEDLVITRPITVPPKPKPE